MKLLPGDFSRSICILLLFFWILDKMNLSAKATNVVSFLTVPSSPWNERKQPVNVFMKWNQRVFSKIWIEDSKSFLYAARPLYFLIADGKVEEYMLVFSRSKITKKILWTLHSCLWCLLSIISFNTVSFTCIWVVYRKRNKHRFLLELAST